MAEIVVNLVIKQLGSLLVQEVKSLRGVHKEIADFKTELESIRCFLKDAEAKAASQALQGNNNEGVEILVSEVRELAYLIEDVIDESAFTVAQLRHGRGLFGVLQRINCSIKKLKLRHNIANDIQDIKSLLVKIDERRKRYGFNSIEQRLSFERNTSQPDGYGVGSYYMEEDEIVGYESVRAEINELLMNRIPQRRVIALIGAGGLGKTTLAASAYKNNNVRSHFDCHAWIYVGRMYNMENLLKNLIQKIFKSINKSVPGNIETMSTRGNIETMDKIGLIDMLRKYLKDKRYMVVFDDVWKDEFWEEISMPYPITTKATG